MSALALDRQVVEKNDFPLVRRGYDPAAVAAHLEALANEIDHLQRELAQAGNASGRPSPPSAPAPSLAVAASDQVRMIVEAAESSAAQIERSAQEQAAEINARAQGEALRLRDEAVQRSEEHVERVGEVTAGMLQRVDTMEGELGALLATLRTGTNRLTADLSVLHESLGDLHAGPQPSEPPAAPVPVADPAATAEAVAPEPAEVRGDVTEVPPSRRIRP